MAEEQPIPQEEPKLQTPEALEELKATIKSEILNETKAENRKRGLWVTMGVVLGAGAGIGISFYWNTIGGWFNILVGVAIVGILLVGLLLYFLLFFKSTILAKIFGVGRATYEDIFSTLYKPAQQLVEKNLPASTYEQKVNPYLAAIEKGGRQLIAYQSYRRSRRMLFGLFISLVIGLGGIIGTVLLLRQNELVGKQNTLLVDQNALITTQNQLVEGQRRSSLIFMMSNIMDKVDEEIHVQKEEVRTNLKESNRFTQLKDPKALLGSVQSIEDIIDTLKWRLSSSLIGRISALSHAFKPHQSLEGDSLSKSLSPERGQLLMALTKSDLDSSTFAKIYKGATFRQSDLRNVDLSNANLKGADLGKTDFSGANLNHANLKEAKLSWANFYETDLSGALLEKASLMFADLSASRLIDADFRTTNMMNAVLISAKMHETNLTGSTLIKADLSFADLVGANLEEAVLSGTNLTEADLSGANLFNSKVSKEQLLSTYCLRHAKNFPNSLRDSIMAENPDLFISKIRFQ